MRGRAPSTRVAAWGTATMAAVVLLAACGATRPVALDRTDVAPLIALSHRIATEGRCAQVRDIRTLRAKALELVNAGRVPTALLEPFTSGVGALGALSPVCLPPTPVVTTTTETTTASVPPAVAPGRDGRHDRRNPGHGRKEKK